MNRAPLVALFGLCAALALMVSGARAQVVPAPAALAGVYNVRLEVTEAGPRCGERGTVGDVTSALWAIDTTGGGRAMTIRWIGDPVGFMGGRTSPVVVAGPALQATWSPVTSDQDQALLGVAADGVITGQLRMVRGGCTVVRSVNAQRVR